MIDPPLVMALSGVMGLFASPARKLVLARKAEAAPRTVEPTTPPSVTAQMARIADDLAEGTQAIAGVARVYDQAAKRPTDAKPAGRSISKPRAGGVLNGFAGLNARAESRFR